MTTLVFWSTLLGPRFHHQSSYSNNSVGNNLMSHLIDEFNETAHLKISLIVLFQITFPPLEFILVHFTLPHPSFFIYAAKAAMHVVTKRCKYTDLPKQHSL